MRLIQIVVLTLTLLTLSYATAEIITDGSLGAKVELSGKDFQITPELGQQFGGNLFHSFQTFNLNSDEAATFSGATSVQNVIARVTGGLPSNIDGTLRSTIPNADLYLINPYGVMFGQNAKLDLQGGFHVTTADYLKLQDGGQFDARNVNNSLLSVAPVAAFGFLTDSPAPISTQDTMLIVPPMKPLSLIGGHLQLTGHLPIQFDDTNTYASFATSLLHTAGGQINLVAVGSAGEVMLNNDLTLTGRGGDITLNRTLIDTSGLGSGNLKIRGNRLQMQDSTLQANNLGEFDGGLMDIQLTESLHAYSEPYYFYAFASKSLLGRGKSGAIAITVPELVLKRAWLHTNTLTEADAGSIDLAVSRLKLLEGAGLNSGAARGKGGIIRVNATESILITGNSMGIHPVNGFMLTDLPSFIDSTSFPSEDGSLGGGEINLTTPRLDLVGGIISSATLGSGNAGSIVIQADNVNVTEGSFISAVAQRTGLAGNIRLDVKDTLFLSGRSTGTFITPATNMRFEHGQSSIVSYSLFGAGGQIDVTAKTIHMTKEGSIATTSLGLSNYTASIHLKAENLLVMEGAQINTSNGFYAGTDFLYGNGRGGDILIQAKQITLSSQQQYLQRTGIFSDTYSQGLGGNLSIQAESLDISGETTISARSFNTGEAGQITLQANHLHLQHGGSINTSTLQSGGGNIVLNGSTGQLYLDNGEIVTSVATGQGSGGDIIIEQPQFIILNHAQIKAQADAGHGGNISIVAQHFVPSFDSLISASSNLGIDGQVIIESPTEDVGNQVLNLSANFLNASALLPLSCAARIVDQRPSEFTRPFTLKLKPHTFSHAPEDAHPSSLTVSN